MTLFSIPKPFIGLVATIQENALRSWLALPGVEVVLVGDEQGIPEAAAAHGVRHIANVSKNDQGTPLLDSALAEIEASSDRGVRCFVNADIVLLDDFAPALSRLHAINEPFLMVGETVDVVVTEELALDDPTVRGRLAERARSEGRSRGATAIDYFVFTATLFDPLPPFAIGRAGFDNWLVWRARSRGVVIDATRAVLAIHQHHDYSHAGGHDEAHRGLEAQANLSLAGGPSRMYTIHDASRYLTSELQLRRNLGSLFRARERLRKATWKIRQAV